MSIFYTVVWIIQAWKFRVSDQTILNCFKKKILVRAKSSPSPIDSQSIVADVSVPTKSNPTESPPIDYQPNVEPGLSEEIRALYDEVAEKLGNDDIIPLDEFLNPSDESSLPEAA